LNIGMDKILKILDESNTKATFFVLGWIAQRHAELIKDLHRRGHEIATHGYSHNMIYEMSPGIFKEDLKKSISIIEEIIKDKIIGHRASNFSVVKESLWSLDIMSECGIRYDASIFPIKHHRYGIPDAERFPHSIDVREGRMKIAEFPCSTIRLLGKNIPFSGGGYFRLMPYQLVKACIKSLNRASKPAMVYLHPWELDPNQPREKVKWNYRFMHYINLGKTQNKLKKLVKDFSFTTVKDVLGL
ncbi:MAG: XrtA system polysaccharide deacetylase, partial [Candidatus Omnitrophota bacterium]